jgi:hypothetical protein
MNFENLPKASSLAVICNTTFDKEEILLEIIEKLKQNLISDGYDEDEVDTFIEENKDSIEGKVYENDKSSDVLKDLLRNTRDIVTAYNTGYEVNPDSWRWSLKEIKSEIKQIKRVLGLKISDTTWDAEIELMVRQASYGGKLVVYFLLDPSDIFDFEKNSTHITFSNAEIAIVDMAGGSGDSCHLHRSKFTLNLENKNFFFDRCVTYSYTYDVCGMFDTWCQNTEYKLEVKRSRAKKVRVTLDSSVVDHMEQQKKYQLAFQAGGCTFGDTDITRHRNVTYLNAYPCGNKCQSCGHFWVD